MVSRVIEDPLPENIGNVESGKQPIESVAGVPDTAETTNPQEGEISTPAGLEVPPLEQSDPTTEEANQQTHMFEAIINIPLPLDHPPLPSRIYQAALKNRPLTYEPPTKRPLLLPAPVDGRGTVPGSPTVHNSHHSLEGQQAGQNGQWDHPPLAPPAPPAPVFDDGDAEVGEDDPLGPLRGILGPVGVAVAVGTGLVSLFGVVFGWKKVREWRERREGKAVPKEEEGRVRRRHVRDWRVKVVG
jgi:hypothetical protein